MVIGLQYSEFRNKPVAFLTNAEYNFLLIPAVKGHVLTLLIIIPIKKIYYETNIL